MMSSTSCMSRAPMKTGTIRFQLIIMRQRPRSFSA